MTRWISYRTSLLPKKEHLHPPRIWNNAQNTYLHLHRLGHSPAPPKHTVLLFHHNKQLPIHNMAGDTSWFRNAQLNTTGFLLDPQKSIRVPSFPGWSGRIWARTGCQFDQLGTGTCLTGDCGGRLECDGNGAMTPATLFEITLGKGSDKDFYDVSIVDGYNLPLIASPVGECDLCNTTGCVADINLGCLKELQVMGEEDRGEGVIACRSACEAFRIDEYCCIGEFANPSTCHPSIYSTLFRRACPRAYSYAFDDETSTFTCKAYDYAIVFCPTADRTNMSSGGYESSNQKNSKSGFLGGSV